MVSAPRSSDRERRAEELADLAIALHDEPSVDETVDRVLEYALKAVDCRYAGVIFVHGRRKVETAAATDPLIEALDQVQMECGEGPDIDVLVDRYSVLVSDTRTDTRWPTWAARVAAHGIHSMISVRLYTSASTIGTLNLYDPEPDKFDVDDQAVAHLLARHAAVALAAARTTENLWQAVDARKAGRPGPGHLDGALPAVRRPVVRGADALLPGQQPQAREPSRRTSSTTGSCRGSGRTPDPDG